MLEEIKKEQSSEAEIEPKILHTFEWVDREGVRGEKGLEYSGVIRYARPEDMEGVQVVERDKHVHRMERGERKYDLSKDPDMGEFENIFKEPDKFISLILTIDGEIVAHIDFGIDRERPNTVEFGTIATIEKYQNNGFMTKLLYFAEQEAQNVFGAETIRISTQEKNKDAVEYYSNPKRGYTDEGERIERDEEWMGERPYKSIIFVKHLKKIPDQDASV
ncbi:MAG TPA: GNAT family N-acetyltransferase [Negativicutes bacterium]|nr:GNAT family N-acetyltransferase [Negativicutes bacterium]